MLFQSGRWRVALLSSLIAMVSLAGCVARVRNPVPDGQVEAASVPGFDGVRIRYWGDQPDVGLQDRLVERLREVTTRPATTRPIDFDVLCVSGGGPDGAFGAGVLYGWGKTGRRPSFRLVTGVSAGALIAPFAFVANRDDKLKEAFTTIDTGDILIFRILAGLLRQDSIADAKPFRRLVETYITEDLLDQIAEEHGKGRRLWIETCNLDAQRPVIWDMGAIAASRRPERLELFRKVLMASAAFPGLFPPAYIDVQVGDRRFEEMHVDGGTTANVVFTGGMLNLAAAKAAAGIPSGALRVRAYVLWNGMACAERKEVRASTKDIAVRALETYGKSHTSGDVSHIFHQARDNEIEFHYLAIPETYERGPIGTLDVFNRREMNRLFEEGRRQGSAAGIWSPIPPGCKSHPSSTARPVISERPSRTGP